MPPQSPPLWPRTFYECVEGSLPEIPKIKNIQSGAVRSYVFTNRRAYVHANASLLTSNVSQRNAYTLPHE